MLKTKELWKPISDFPNYAVSNLGRVKRLTSVTSTKAEYILNPWTANGGYQYVRLHHEGQRKTPYIHHLVAYAFIGQRPPGKWINHIDGHKKNNAVKNLEYITPKESALHALKLGLLKPAVGILHGRARFTNEGVLHIRWLIKQGFSKNKISKIFGASIEAISKIANGTTWKHL